MSRLRSLLLVLPLLAVACGGGNDDTPTSPTPPSLGIPFSTTDIRFGTGLEALNGRRVSTNYTLWLYEVNAAENKGTQVQSGVFPAFIVGGGGVITGYDQGVRGMRVGGLRRVVVPPEMGYGVAGRPPEIPGNATLIFEIELTAVQ